MAEENPIQYVLAEFLDALDDQVSGAALVAAGHQIDFYFDAADLMRCVQGMYYSESTDTRHESTPPVFDFSPLEKNVFLVDCLALEGLTRGTIRLLSPHLLEFYNNYKNNFSIKRTRYRPYQKELLQTDSHGEAEKYDEKNFFLELRLALEEDPALNTAFSWLLSEGENATTPAETQADPEILFQILSSIGSWQHRFDRLRGYTDLSHDLDFQPRKLRKHEVYEPFIEVFMDVRRDRLTQNVADALAMAELATKISDFKEKKSSRVPHFFLFGDLQLSLQIRASLRKHNLEEFFIYEVNGRTVSALKDWHYYVFRSIFTSSDNKNGKTLDPTALALHLHAIRESFEEELLNADKAITNPEADTGQFQVLEAFDAATQLRAKLADFIRSTFLVHVLEPFCTRERLRDLIAGLSVSERFQPWVLVSGKEEEVRAIAALQNLAEDSKRAHPVFNGFLELNTIRSRLNADKMTDEALWRALGFVQMRVSDEAKATIIEKVRALTSKTSHVAQDARVDALVSCYKVLRGLKEHGRNVKSIPSIETHAAVVCCLLYVCQLGAKLQGKKTALASANLLREILGELELIEDWFWKDVMEAIIQLRLHKTRSKSESIKEIKKIGLKFKQQGNTVQRLDRAYSLVAEGLCYSLGWRALVASPEAYPEGYGKFLTTRHDGIDKLHQECLTLLRAAYNIFTEETFQEKCMRTYVCNGQLYGAMRSASPSAAEVDEYAKCLMSREEQHRVAGEDCWQVIYDDTLADYHFVKATDAQTSADLEREVRLGYERMESAMAGIARDDIQDRFELLKRYAAEKGVMLGEFSSHFAAVITEGEGEQQELPES